MVIEVTVLDIREESIDVFPAAAAEGIVHLKSDQSVGAVSLYQAVENPAQFTLIVEWDSVESHGQFGETEAFQGWRAAVSDHYAQRPTFSFVTQVL